MEDNIDFGLCTVTGKRSRYAIRNYFVIIVKNTPNTQLTSLLPTRNHTV